MASRWVAVVLACAMMQAACAAARRPVTTAVTPEKGVSQVQPVASSVTRPRVGVAFGGGSARGLAHIGVIRWLEEHRIPIDLVAGTSMGGLVGGTFATGLDVDELQALLTTLDWDTLFGSSDFAYKNIRRKVDARDYPSRIEFGVRNGIVPPAALNNGEQVELLLTRIAAPYYSIGTFDELPTPFRAIATDIARAEQVILDRGSLALAMRSTMSLPLVFPPVDVDGRLLVDGGLMNNVPADVARAMGADRVIAVNVGELGGVDTVDDTLLGLTNASIDAMMRVAARRGIAGADVRIDVPLTAYTSMDFRRGDELAAEGYKAADAAADTLLPLAVSEEEYARWKAERQQRRRRTLPTPTYLEVEGFASGDANRLAKLMARHIDTPIDVEAVQEDLATASGLDRYETVSWWPVASESGATGLLARGRPKPYAPPFLMLGVNLENTTSSDYRITGTARYLAYNVGTSASELRVDATIGSDPAVAAELFTPIGTSPLFVAPKASYTSWTFNLVDDEKVYARYGQDMVRADVAAGVNLGVKSDVRISAFADHLTAKVEVGDPIFPTLDGLETGADLTWRYDGQDSPVVPSRGTVAVARLSRIFHNPDVLFEGAPIDIGDLVTQLTLRGNHFWSVGRANRVFLSGGFGHTWGGNPFPHNIFMLGGPFRLGGYRTGEIYGNDFYLATSGYLRQVARLPDFIGGPVYVGGWLENGDAFDEWAKARWRSNVSSGVIMDTILGPAMVGASAGFDGRWRMFIGIGRLLH